MNFKISPYVTSIAFPISSAFCMQPLVFMSGTPSSREDSLFPLTPPYVPFGIRRFNITSKHDVRRNMQDSLLVQLLRGLLSILLSSHMYSLPLYNSGSHSRLSSGRCLYQLPASAVPIGVSSELSTASRCSSEASSLNVRQLLPSLFSWNQGHNNLSIDGLSANIIIKTLRFTTL